VGRGVPVLFRLCSGWVGVPLGFPPSGFPPLPRRVPRREFFFALRLQQRIACVSAAATRRIIALFSRNFSATVCMSTHKHLCRPTCRQTNRQTDHGTYHATPRGSWWRICGMPCHATPRHHSGADLWLFHRNVSDTGNKASTFYA
jgi:hypothetical protein